MNGASERSSEWPSTPICILGYSGSQCRGANANAAPASRMIIVRGFSHDLERGVCASRETNVNKGEEVRFSGKKDVFLRDEFMFKRDREAM